MITLPFEQEFFDHAGLRELSEFSVRSVSPWFDSAYRNIGIFPVLSVFAIFRASKNCFSNWFTCVASVPLPGYPLAPLPIDLAPGRRTPGRHREHDRLRLVEKRIVDVIDVRAP